MAIKPKKTGLALEVRTFRGIDGTAYVVFRTAAGSFHTFQEVEAKAAARKCGARKEGTTRQIWESLWKE
jgi:hypothetical protein